MVKFDTRTYLEIAGRGGGPVQAIGTAFGMPSCLLNLSEAVLNALPFNILQGIRASTEEGVAAADDVLKAAFSKLRWLTGIIEYDTEAGDVRYISDTSEGGIDQNEGGFLNDLTGFLGALGGFAGNLYNNYNLIAGQIESIEDCLQGYKTYLEYSNGNAVDKKMALARIDPEALSQMNELQFALEKRNIQEARNFINQANSLLNTIDTILYKRLVDPGSEPEFNSEYAQYLTGTSFRVEVSGEDTSAKEVFRLTFGPPKSRSGQFLLSIDGLYFDSQSSGITPALVHVKQKESEVPIELKWRFEHDPNLGGRGEGFTLGRIKEYIDTILDINYIDESEFMRRYYDADNFLEIIIGQRNKRIYDLSAQISKLESEGAAQSIISNMYQAMYSENAGFIEKIDKRKKQIELAVKIPSLYGKNVFYAPGNVPINDFSYLEGTTLLLDLQKQRSLVLTQVDISGVVLPISATYVVSPVISPTISIDHLLISHTGIGSVIYESSSLNENGSVILEITDPVVTDGLFAIYNFLDTHVEIPSSIDWLLDNGNSNNNYNNGKLISKNLENVFSKGLGIPFLNGITLHSSATPSQPTGIGNFIILPETKEFNDLLYSKTGATIDFWVHLPYINNATLGWGQDAGAVSSLYRLVLANENTGFYSPFNRSIASPTNINNLQPDFSDSVVRGLLLGFTRDRRITTNQLPSNDPADNSIDNICFFLAPTQSMNLSSVGFINKSNYIQGDCHSLTEWHCLKKDITEEDLAGNTYLSVGRKFCHIALSFDPTIDKLNVYLDGRLSISSSISEVFAISPGQMPSIPSFKKPNSFEYTLANVGASAGSDLAGGPKLGTYFTPWIVGGGYTDGMVSYGNFMGEYGGIKSGLNGYVGSLKFYSKPLSSSEVLTNYNAQREFFENIDIPALLWEPIISE